MKLQKDEDSFSWSSVWGTVRLVLTSGGGIKIFLWLLIAVFIFCLIIPGVYPLIKLLVGMGTAIWIIKHVMKASENPETQSLFQDSHNWYLYNKMTIQQLGSKKSPELDDLTAEPVQPFVYTEGDIITPAKVDAVKASKERRGK